MTTLKRIKAAAEKAQHTGLHPTKIHLTIDDGRKLQFERMNEDRRLGHRIKKVGIRHAVQKIAGLEVVWRSPEFGVSQRQAQCPPPVFRRFAAAGDGR